MSTASTRGIARGLPIRSCCRTCSARRDDKPIYAPYAVDRQDTQDPHAGRPRDRSADSASASSASRRRRSCSGTSAISTARSTRKAWSRAAREFVPELRAQNVDLVIAISHGGIDASPYGTTMENANWHLAARARHRRAAARPFARGVSGSVAGNAKVASRFADLPEVDNERGFVRGKPAVMGNYWGKSLGVIELALVRRDGHWQIDASATHSEVRNVKKADGTLRRARRRTSRRWSSRCTKRRSPTCRRRSATAISR